MKNGDFSIAMLNYQRVSLDFSHVSGLPDHDVSAASQDRAKMLKACAEGSHSSRRAWQ